MSMLMRGDELVGIYTDFVDLLTALVNDMENGGKIEDYSIEKLSL